MTVVIFGYNVSLYLGFALLALAVGVLIYQERKGRYK